MRSCEDDQTFAGRWKERKKVKARIVPVDILLQPFVKLILKFSDELATLELVIMTDNYLIKTGD